MVKMPAATAARTPMGAFSTTKASAALTPAFPKVFSEDLMVTGKDVRRGKPDPEIFGEDLGEGFIQPP